MRAFADHTEFVVGVTLALVAAFLLYTQYNVGYWGIFALGLIFIIKNWTRPAWKKRASADEKGATVRPRLDDRRDSYYKK